MNTYGLELVRSDTGDGGWSLHAPEMEAEDGIAPVLVSGPAEMVDDDWDWDRPNQSDYDSAQARRMQQAPAPVLLAGTLREAKPAAREAMGD